MTEDSSDPIFIEMLNGTRASVIMLVGSRIEKWVQASLEAKMRPLSNTVTERIFRGYGPLSSFSAKIDIGYALELFDDAIYNDLKAIKDLRNVFAHATDALSYSDKDVAECLRRLTGWKKDSTNTQLHELVINRAIACIEVLEGHTKHAALVQALKTYKAKPEPSR